jgi:hypothetical protein
MRKGTAVLPPSIKQKKEGKNERYIDFTFNTRRVDFCAGVAVAAYGSIHLSEAGLSGPGQEENIRGARRT